MTEQDDEGFQTEAMPEVRLRFVRRDGKLILQQQWIVERRRYGVLEKRYVEWRDVPVEEGV